MKYLILVIFVVESILVLTGHFAHAYDSVKCHQASRIENKNMPRSASEVILDATWCTDFDGSFNLHFVLPFDSLKELTDTDKTMRVYLTLKERMTPLVCNSQNKVWTYADQVNLNFWDQKGRGIAGLFFKKSDCL